MNKPVNHMPRTRISPLVYIPAVISLVPVVGIPFGICTILWGISDWKMGGKKPVLIASVGFLLTVILTLMASRTVNMVLGSPQMVENRTSYAQARMVHIIRYLEYYKLGHGRYPETLQELGEEDLTFFEIQDITDPFTHPYLVDIRREGKLLQYYANPDGSRYNLFATGPDGVAFSQDDVYPGILEIYKSRIGYQPDLILTPSP